MIRDLLYFDFDKAASLQSQTAGGLLKTTQVSEDAGKDRDAGVELKVPGIGGAKLGVAYIEKRSILESRALHHNLLSDLERTLSTDNLVEDLVSQPELAPTSPDAARRAVSRRPYVHAAGSAVIEDYGRMSTILENFNELTTFIRKCAEDSAKKTAEYEEALEKLVAKQAEVNRIKDRNQRTKANAELEKLRELLSSPLANQLVGLPEWLVKGLQAWISIFMRNRINLRIKPFPGNSFELICNLKKSCFVDDDLEHLLYAYGTRPTVPLVVLGAVTSLPQMETEGVKNEAEVPTSRERLERGFGRMFEHLDGLESYSRFDRYPNVMVHPIAVYRAFGTDGSR